MARTERRLVSSSERRLLTVLFTDIVGSTDFAVEMGDARWRVLIARHHRIVRGALKRFGGREIDTAGDGFFATFDKPAQAIRCAAAAVEGVRELGIEIRAGLHLGEVEVAGKHVGGVAVHTGARVLGAALPGEILVTSTLRELVAGSGLGFADRGPHTLKGVPGTWHLFGLAIVDGRALEPVADPSTAAERRAAVEVPTLLRRTRRPAAIAGIAAVMVVAGSIILALRSTPDTRRSAAFEPPSGSVLQVDADDGHTVRRVVRNAVERHGGGNPKLAVGEGGIWVRSAFLQHISGTTRGPFGDHLTIETTGDFRADRGVEVGFHAVWIGGGQAGGNARLLSWNPATDERLPDITIPSRVVINDVALGFGAVWVTLPRRLVKIDPGTRKQVADASLSGIPDGVVAGGGGVWVLDITNGTLTRFDPRTLDRAPSVSVTGSVLGMAADREGVWLLEVSGNDVIPVSPEGVAGDSISVGDNPSGIAVGLGAVWVSDESGDVYRIDRVTEDPTHFHVGGHLTAIAVDEDAGALWLTVGGD